MRIVEQAQKLLDKIAGDKRAKIRMISDQYFALIDDSRYKDIMRPLFEKKRMEKEQEINNIIGDTVEEIGIKFIKLQAEKNVYNNILNAPENYFKTLRDMEKEK